MPLNIINSFAKKSGKSVSEVESLWKKAKKQAEKEGHGEDYPYIVGILKRMVGFNESYYNEEEYFIYGYNEFMLFMNSDLSESEYPAYTSTVMQFSNSLSSLIKLSTEEIIDIFKNPFIHKIFATIKWDFKRFKAELAKAYGYYKELFDFFADILDEIHFTDKKDVLLKYIDKKLKNHPILKKASGFALAILMSYIWMYVISFIGDVNFDFDQDSILKLIDGSYGLYDALGGHNGTKYLLYVFTGETTGVSVKYPGKVEILFLLSFVYTLTLHDYPNISKKIMMGVKKYMKPLKIVNFVSLFMENGIQIKNENIKVIGFKDFLSERIKYSGHFKVMEMPYLIANIGLPVFGKYWGEHIPKIAERFYHITSHDSFPSLVELQGTKSEISTFTIGSEGLAKYLDPVYKNNEFLVELTGKTDFVSSHDLHTYLDENGTRWILPFAYLGNDWNEKSNMQDLEKYKNTMIKLILDFLYSNKEVKKKFEYLLFKKIWSNDGQKFTLEKEDNITGEDIKFIIEKMKKEIPKAYHELVKKYMEFAKKIVNSKYGEALFQDILASFPYGSPGVFTNNEIILSNFKIQRVWNVRDRINKEEDERLLKMCNDLKVKYCGTISTTAIKKIDSNDVDNQYIPKCKKV